MSRERFLVGVLRALLVLVLVTIPIVMQLAHAQTKEDAWLEKSRGILESVEGVVPPPWLRTEPGEKEQAIAEEVASESDTRPKVPTAIDAAAGDQVLIFASLSIPTETLRALLDEAAEANVTLVLRGVPQGKSIPATVAAIKRALPDPQRLANVVIDPTLFQRYHVEQVPTLVLERPGAAKPVIVEGAVTVEWLRRMAAQVNLDGAQLGHRGESYPIGEPDLIQEMQRRMALVDWAAQRRHALSGFWERHAAFVQLPDATQPRQFLVDPSVTVTDDITDANGEILIRAGERFNALEMFPLTKAIIVFRGSDPKQIEAAVDAANKVRSAGHGVIWITTDVERSRGWDHLSEIEKAVAGPVYVLTQTIAERFHLEHVPAVVRSQGTNLLVTEVPVGVHP